MSRHQQVPSNLVSAYTKLNIRSGFQLAAAIGNRGCRRRAASRPLARILSPGKP